MDDLQKGGFLSVSGLGPQNNRVVFFFKKKKKVFSLVQARSMAWEVRVALVHDAFGE